MRRHRPVPSCPFATGEEERLAASRRVHDRSCRACLPALAEHRWSHLPPGSPRRLDAAPIAFLALVGGAMAMGISPVFVRFAEIGPFTSAFWRVALGAAGALALVAAGRPGRRRSAPDASARLSVVIAGLLFAGDLTFWHLAIMKTTVANATFLATLAPVWVVLGSGLFLGETRGAEGLLRPGALSRRRRRPDRRAPGRSTPASSTATSTASPPRSSSAPISSRCGARGASTARAARCSCRASSRPPCCSSRRSLIENDDVAGDALRPSRRCSRWRWSAIPAARACSPSRSGTCRPRSRRW